jgi:hypothetical protein
MPFYAGDIEKCDHRLLRAVEKAGESDEPNLKACFLLDLPSEGFLQRLALAHFAAWKRPELVATRLLQKENISELVFDPRHHGDFLGCLKLVLLGCVASFHLVC